MKSKRFSRPERLLGLDGPFVGLMAGVDEAGRGPLAGPVVAAAVVLDERRPIRGLDDSKLLPEPARDRLDVEIRARALCFAVAEASVEEIDRLNILQATLLAMRRAVEALAHLPQLVLVDGNCLPVLQVPARAVIDGDAKVKAIAAASILAKVHRDALCRRLHEVHPEYGFDAHKGYSTPAHLAALARHGASPHHRRSFAPVRSVLQRDGLWDGAQQIELPIDAAMSASIAAAAAPDAMGPDDTAPDLGSVRGSPTAPAAVEAAALLAPVDPAAPCGANATEELRLAR